MNLLQLLDLSKEDCKRLKNNIQDVKDWIEVWIPAVKGSKGEVLYYSAQLDILRQATFYESYSSNG